MNYMKKGNVKDLEFYKLKDYIKLSSDNKRMIFYIIKECGGDIIEESSLIIYKKNTFLIYSKQGEEHNNTEAIYTKKENRNNGNVIELLNFSLSELKIYPSLTICLNSKMLLKNICKGIKSISTLNDCDKENAKEFKKNN